MGWQSATQIQRISTAKQTSAVPRIRQPTPDHNASSPDRTIPIQNTSLTYQLPVWSGMAWLDLRRLTYFHAIVEAGSISEASRRLNVPQPALSYHLKELEADFGAPLLSRSAKGVTLTEGGKPCKFGSVDAVMFELDGAPNVDTARLVIETANYWQH